MGRKKSFKERMAGIIRSRDARMLALVLLFLAVGVIVLAQDVTITTYYPAPFGVYSQLVTRTLGVGDTDGSGTYDGSDAPPIANDGDVWIAGDVAIGTRTPTQALTVNGDIDMIKGQSSRIHRLGEMSFDWTTGGTYDNPQYHGIQSKDEAGNWGDELRINSYNDVINTLDSNNNDVTSYFKIQHHSSTDGADLFWVRSDNSSTHNGSAYLRNRLNIGTTGTGTGALLQVGGTTTDNLRIYASGGWVTIRADNTDVEGAAVSGHAYMWGVFGTAQHYGVYGLATGTGVNDGVRGESQSPSGRGVVAYASSSTGTPSALEARVVSSAGWAGTFWGRIRASVTSTIAGHGGHLFTDIAEEINVRDCSDGDVVVIDPENNVTVTKSTKAYDPTVAGIISETPIFHIFDNNIKGESKPLALAGRVHCKATTENGPIKRGDVLVTSSKPGYAMKADLDRVKLGMIVGKALEPLKEGEGKIIVLVD